LSLALLDRELLMNEELTEALEDVLHTQRWEDRDAEFLDRMRELTSTAAGRLIVC